jgi:hypothetical protein
MTRREHRTESLRATLAVFYTVPKGKIRYRVAVLTETFMSAPKAKKITLAFR